MQRTAYCGQINNKFINQEVHLYGWVHSVRNHGKLIFIDLRDREGVVQVVVNENDPANFKIATSLHNEYVIQIHGKVRARPANLINKAIKTGEIEVETLALKILNTAEPLPFNLNEYQELNEDIRLRYRYLDLRRHEMAQRMMMRAKISQLIRNYLNAQNFIEIETPILTKSTPEGARHYLVPSRNYPGQFYALPQSPQIFKQLLMASGMDRYYQLPRCFRDEDLRADRQPEFTQLDIEMSFIDESQLQDLIEGLMRHLFKETIGVTLPNPFPRLTYAESMAKYGSDKPDLRFALELIDVSDSVKDASLEIFAKYANDSNGKVAVIRLPDGAKLSRKQIDDYTKYINIFGAKGLAYIKVTDPARGAEGLQSSLLKFLSPAIIDALLKCTQAKANDMLFFVADQIKIVHESLGALRLKLAQDLKLVDETAWRMLWVTDFPMFEKQADGSITFLHHPFTASYETDPQKLLAAPEHALARAYDLVLNGTELGGGSIRIHDLKMQLAVFKILGLSEEETYTQFGHLLEAFKYGYPPEGGIAFGLDRIVMLLSGAKAIRDVIAFPKTQTASCPLTRAPSEVSAKQLQELGISVRKK